MAQFIHLTDERVLRRVEKTGLKLGAVWNSSKKGFFATPVLEDFMVSHQWLRELKRKGIRTIAAVQFRIGDDEPVSVGRYGQPALETTAAGAIRIFREHVSGLGLEVVIPRKIHAKEIIRTYLPPQVTGWRFYPEAKGKTPCGCPYCARGEVNSRERRQAYAREMAGG